MHALGSTALPLQAVKARKLYRQECKIFLAHWYLQMKGYINFMMAGPVGAKIH